jgi:hypothetical protein
MQVSFNLFCWFDMLCTLKRIFLHHFLNMARKNELAVQIALLQYHDVRVKEWRAIHQVR